jgi:hypothetical protein
MKRLALALADSEPRFTLRALQHFHQVVKRHRLRARRLCALPSGLKYLTRYTQGQSIG